MSKGQFTIGQSVIVLANGGTGVVIGATLVHESDPSRSRWTYDVLFDDGSEDLLAESELADDACRTKGRTAIYAYRINEQSQPKEQSWNHPTRRRAARPVA